MADYLRLMRVEQWVKNLLIFTPTIFAFQLFDICSLFSSVIAFLSFSLTASSIYIFNDIRDAEMDRLHPRKRHRPFASGSINSSKAYRLSILLLIPGISLAALLGIGNISIVLLYILLNIAYTLKLKHMALIDIFCIALGFVLRIYMGGYAASLELSPWILIMTFLLAIFMALAKRRDDMIFFLNGRKVRRSIERYNLKLIDCSMVMSAVLVSAAYLMYCMSSEVISEMGSVYVYLTFPFVLLGLMRYLQITFVLEDSGSPTEIILKDRLIQGALMGWLLTFLFLIYR